MVSFVSLFVSITISDDDMFENKVAQIFPKLPKSSHSSFSIPKKPKNYQ